MNICVFGSASEDIGEQYKKDTEAICKALAECGNNLVFGGGDYFGVNNELVGRWAGDALYIDDEEPAESFTEIFPIFREKWQNFKV